MRGILLDRDGVINRQRPDYVRSWAEFELLPGVLDALVRLAQTESPILIVTNQACIGRGLVAAETIDEIHQALAALVRGVGGRLDGFFVCPHPPEDSCGCRKPAPGLLLAAGRAHALTLSESYFIGDALTDLQAARATGCRPLLVRSGLAGPRLPTDLAHEVPDVPLFDDLGAAVDWLLEAWCI